VIVTLFWLLVGHSLCDYPLQGEYLAAAKRRNSGHSTPWWIALTAHSLIHAGMVFLVTGNFELGLLRPVKSPAPSLTKQPHGGAIHQGPAANVVPGPGRPPSAIRAALARSFDQRRPIYEEIADGQATERIEVELEEVAGLIVCEGCGAGFVPKKDVPVDRLVVRAWRSARVRDRLGHGLDGEVRHWRHSRRSSPTSGSTQTPSAS
jgi:hypothetical protein